MKFDFELSRVDCIYAFRLSSVICLLDQFLKVQYHMISAAPGMGKDTWGLEL